MKSDRLCLPFCLATLWALFITAAHAATLSGELKTWHRITLTFEGPHVSETDEVNPFTDYRLDVIFRHAKSEREYRIPGHFAADGDAANSSATEGSTWRVHFAPDAPGEWIWTAQFRQGNFVAVSSMPTAGKPAGYMDGESGSLVVAATDKSGRDFRAHGRLVYDGTHYPRFLGSGKRFLKQGPDAPENFLSYADFDGTFHDDGHKDHLVKTWEAHRRDWQSGDPFWQEDKGRAMIGALNYIAGKEMNSVSMLTMNIMGDDQNVFPFVDYETHDRYDVSKLDQWELVFSHAQELGLFLHFKLTEMESQGVLDNGGVGLQTRLYFREMVSRFGHHLALNWNLGEENGEWIPNHPTPPMDTLARHAMTGWFDLHDPYDHPVVIHNGIPFDDMLGPAGKLDGASLQVGPWESNKRVQEWRMLSRAAGRPWIVAHDEHGPANFALPPDDVDPDHLDSRQGALWGALLGGAWGNEWYFGYKHPHSDLTAQDWRTRDRFWDMAAHALSFFSDHAIPFWDMVPANPLLSDPTGYCLAATGEIYIVYLRKVGDSTRLDLGRRIGLYTGLGKEAYAGTYDVRWYDPRNGGELQTGSIPTLINQLDTQDAASGDSGHSRHELGQPPSAPEQDWVILVKRRT